MLRAITREQFLKEHGFIHNDRDIAAYLEDGNVLFNTDWNGEQYNGSVYVYGNVTTPRPQLRFRPVQRPYPDSPDDYEIIGYVVF